MRNDTSLNQFKQYKKDQFNADIQSVSSKSISAVCSQHYSSYCGEVFQANLPNKINN
jgi:hypothetical protein